uniref:Putative cathepsin b group n=1 Tax=Psorophora albipes TaxID=869069 RepID=T1DIC1_9DIPT
MNRLSVIVVFALLAISAVSAGLTNTLRQRCRDDSGSGSFENSGGSYDAFGYGSPQFNQSAFGYGQLPFKRAMPSRSGKVLPAMFDARRHWSQCKSIGMVMDQGCCSASHALVPTAVMSDRMCIHSNGTMMKMFSALEPLLCCKECAMNPMDKCTGGSPTAVWKYWKEVGIVSGGPSANSKGCLPYPYQSNCLKQTCPNQCVPGSRMTMKTDRTKGVEVYRLNPSVQDIKMEIFERGPVETTIRVHLGLTMYKGGICREQMGPYLGNQSIKLIGWGMQEGVEYWLAVNSWGEMWGERGLLKLLAGQDHLGVESNVHAGMPMISRKSMDY